MPPSAPSLAARSEGSSPVPAAGTSRVSLSTMTSGISAARAAGSGRWEPWERIRARTRSGWPAAPRDRQPERDAALGFWPFDQSLGLTCERRIARHPHALSWPHPAEVWSLGALAPGGLRALCVAAEPQHDLIAVFFHLEHRPTDLLGLGLSGIEDHAHAGSNRHRGEPGTARSLLRAAETHEGRSHRARRRRRLSCAADSEPAAETLWSRLARHEHLGAAHLAHPAEIEAAVLGKASLDQRLMVRAGEKAVAEAASVGERHVVEVARERRLLRRSWWLGLRPSPGVAVLGGP